MFELGQKVTLTANGVAGEVRGIWDSVSGARQYDVRYFDSSGRHCDGWFLEGDLTAAA